MRFDYETELIAEEEHGGAYVVFPHDIRSLFHKGRLKVHASFDGVPYDGNIVNMGLKNPDGSVRYIIGVRRDIRKEIRKEPGDMIRVIIETGD